MAVNANKRKKKKKSQFIGVLFLFPFPLFFLYHLLSSYLLYIFISIPTFRPVLPIPSAILFFCFLTLRFVALGCLGVAGVDLSNLCLLLSLVVAIVFWIEVGIEAALTSFLAFGSLFFFFLGKKPEGVSSQAQR